MSAHQNFSYLNHSRKHRDYETEIILHGQKVIPSDTFWIAQGEFVILDFPKKSERIYVKILGIKGTSLGQIYMVPQSEFENLNSERLSVYRQF
jgi:hypothetical protein